MIAGRKMSVLDHLDELRKRMCDRHRDGRGILLTFAFIKTIYAFIMGRR